MIIAKIIFNYPANFPMNGRYCRLKSEIHLLSISDFERIKANGHRSIIPISIELL